MGNASTYKLRDHLYHKHREGFDIKKIFVEDNRSDKLIDLAIHENPWLTWVEALHPSKGRCNILSPLLDYKDIDRKTLTLAIDAHANVQYILIPLLGCQVVLNGQ